MNRIAKFAALPWQRKALLLRCWVELNETAIALRLLPLSDVLRRMKTNTTARATRTNLVKEDIIWSVRAAAALSWRPTCAVRALVGERALRRYGFPAQFKVGVTGGDDFQAHAWVEDETGVLIGRSEQSYRALSDLVPRKVASS